jgi:hypothetical protein
MLVKVEMEVMQWDLPIAHQSVLLQLNGTYGWMAGIALETVAKHDPNLAHHVSSETEWELQE